MKNKAKLLEYSNDRYDKATYGHFEYRGKEYLVRYAGWNCASDEEPWMQHRREQAKIDKMLDEPKHTPTPEEIEAAQKRLKEAFDMFFNYEG